MDEFGLIARYFAPLTRGFDGALELTDDAAVFAPPLGHDIVVTKDAIAQGVHFIGNEAPSLIARKLLRVNLSDLAAMGAQPLTYFLAVMLPKTTDTAWVRQFADGLQEDQNSFDIPLGGGDTIAVEGPMSFSITALGTVPSGAALKRTGAQTDDIIYVSGTLGDSALGLRLLQGNEAIAAHLQENDKLYLRQRYWLPEPRLALGQKLRGIATACMDISDGLVQDLSHICRASQAGAVIERERLPLSAPSRHIIEGIPAHWEHILAGGDDYELLFTVPQKRQMQVEALAGEIGLPLTAIGLITESHGVRVIDETGRTIATPSGFRHF